MTIKEQIYIEDKYRQLKDDLALLDDQIGKSNNIEETMAYIDEQISIRSLMFFINDFITFAGYEWRKPITGWTLFEREEG